MGFNRQPQPQAMDRADVRNAVVQAFAAIDTSTPADPFGIDHDCLNPAGHYPIRLHREIVCPFCSKVIWS